MPKNKLPDGRSLVYGDRGVGSAVVLLHPIGLAGACWQPVAERLASRYRVLTPDLAGHGASDRPAGPYDLALIADDIAELIETEEAAPVAAIGLSMGGMVALALAERHPRLVSAVVVLNSAARVPEAIIDAVRARADRARAQGMDVVGEETLTRWFTPGFAEQEPEVIATTRRVLLGSDAQVHADAWLGLAQADFESELRVLHQPLLVVTGSLDHSVSAESGAHTAALAPSGRHVHLEGAGHMSPLEEPDRITELVIDFLEDGRRP